VADPIDAHRGNARVPAEVDAFVRKSAHTDRAASPAHTPVAARAAGAACGSGSPGPSTAVCISVPTAKR
jgi:hypothetical protein